MNSELELTALMVPRPGTSPVPLVRTSPYLLGEHFCGMALPSVLDFVPSEHYPQTPEGSWCPSVERHSLRMPCTNCLCLSPQRASAWLGVMEAMALCPSACLASFYDISAPHSPPFFQAAPYAFHMFLFLSAPPELASVPSSQKPRFTAFLHVGVWVGKWEG